MSKIALAPSASGTGTLTISAPNTNSDFTLALPATTAPILAGSGITLSASAPANTLVTDASGNVGIGVTPSASSLSGFIEGAYGTFGQTSSLGTTIAGNAYYNSGWKYKLSSTATLHIQDSSGISWSVAPSGTPGNAISFSEAMRITTAGLLQFNSGYGSVATAYGCRAWVNFNGTGTVAIRASGNVSSITDNDTGDYTLNFTTALPDANYSATGSARSPGIASGAALQFETYNTTSLRFFTRGTTTGPEVDLTIVNVAIFR